MTTFGRYPAQAGQRLWSAIKNHRRSLDVLLPLLGAVFVLDIATFSAGFGSNDDPGTYAAQAWAVLNRGTLAHYTYWYDHPPFGWLQISAYAWLTDGFGRSDIAVLMASEFMVIAQLVSCVLIFMLMRRLNFNRAFAALAVVLFVFSPLAIFYQKMAFLDNIAVPWLLAGMVLAVSPRRSLGSACGAGLCMAGATLTKETSVIWLPVVLYLLWQNHGKRKNEDSGNRSWGFGVFLPTYVTVCGLYILYAVLKGELFPGKGHVSLWGALTWQLTRAAAGSDTLHGWLQTDHMLLYAAVVAVPVGLFFRRLRPIVLGFVLVVLMVVRGGYIPQPFVIGALPFAALLIAGVLGGLWPYRNKIAACSKPLLVVRFLLVTSMLVGGTVAAAPGWAAAARQDTSQADVLYYQQTISWIEQNVPHDAVIAVDDNMWLDLKRAHYTNVVWFYKLDLDPAVSKQYVPNGYEGIQYIAMKQLYFYIARDSTGGNSVISQAAQHSTLVTQIGNPGNYTATEITNLYVVYKVNGGTGR
jgi:4-amino-4-deoxy-L-arabinose transferase-like glycosyltransferase